MVENGMQAAGYEYINIDDCWHGEARCTGKYSSESTTLFPLLKSAG